MRARKFFLGVVTFACLVLNTLFWGLLIYLVLPLKIFAPTPAFCRRVTRVMVQFGESWIAINCLGLAWLHRIEWRVSGLETVVPADSTGAKSYLVIANHRSWVDIVVLQKIFNRRIPFLRFFLKSQLLYVPILGGAWWALDFPFMKRHSREVLARHPEKRAEDYESVRRAGKRFRGTPVSVLNFLEGTRWTAEKQAAQGSPYRYLLPPKAGGLAFVMEAMGDQFDAILDVTIHYSQATVSLWDLLSGQIRRIDVHVRSIPVPQDLFSGRYLEDALVRDRVQTWVRSLWLEKDRIMDAMDGADSRQTTDLQ
ncbi:MAG: acyltransferase [Bdellovibrionaceae bacterium]|nr:acyltransferase [Pseudobdellovibrionaceae bacterium]